MNTAAQKFFLNGFVAAVRAGMKPHLVITNEDQNFKKGYQEGRNWLADGGDNQSPISIIRDAALEALAKEMK